MKNSNATDQLQLMAISALLCALGITIPMFAPKIVLEPASFTLASHVPVFLSVFISPVSALAVSICTGIGFFFSTSPVIALRALSHVGFALLGALLLKKNGALLCSLKTCIPYGILLSVIHAVCEVFVVSFFYFGNGMMQSYYDSGYFKSVILLVGIGTVIHSMIDFGISVIVWKPVSKVIRIPVSAKMTKVKVQ